MQKDLQMHLRITNNSTLEKQIDAVDDELDKLDDEFEYAYQMKEISFETYKARERAIENWKMNWN